MAHSITRGGTKVFKLTAKDRKRIESQQTESDREFKQAYDEWQKELAVKKKRKERLNRFKKIMKKVVVVTVIIILLVLVIQYHDFIISETPKVLSKLLSMLETY